MFNIKVTPVLGFAAIAFFSGCGTTETTLINSRQAPVEMMSMMSPLSSKFRSELVSVVHFEFDSDELDTAALQIIEGQAALILDNPNIRFSVTGHTDRVGNNSYNMELGMRRANRVVAALVTMGVNEQQLLAQISMGEEENIIETDDRERANRRVLTEVMGPMPEFRTAAILRNDDDDDRNSDRRWSSLVSIDPEDEAPEDEAPEDEAPEDEAPEDEAPEDEAPENEAPEDEAPEEGGPVGGNPGNDKGVGGAGENPTDDDGWGEGDRGRSG